MRRGGGGGKRWWLDINARDLHCTVSLAQSVVVLLRVYVCEYRSSALWDCRDRHTEPSFFVRRTDTDIDTAFFVRQLYVLQHGGGGGGGGGGGAHTHTVTATVPVFYIIGIEHRHSATDQYMYSNF